MRALRARGRKGLAEAGSAGVGEKEIKGSGTGRAKGGGGDGGSEEEEQTRWAGAPARGPAGRPRRRKGEAMQTVCANESGVKEKERARDANRRVGWSAQGLREGAAASGDARANLGGHPAPRPPGDRRHHDRAEKVFVHKLLRRKPLRLWRGRRGRLLRF